MDLRTSYPSDSVIGSGSDRATSFLLWSVFRQRESAEGMLTPQTDEASSHLPSRETQLQTPRQLVATDSEAPNLVENTVTVSPSGFDPRISRDAAWYQYLVFFVMLASIINIAGIFTLYLAGSVPLFLALLPDFPSASATEISFAIIDWLPLYVFLYLTLFILSTLLLDDLSMKQHQRPLCTKLASLSSWVIFIGFLCLAIAAYTRYYYSFWSPGKKYWWSTPTNIGWLSIAYGFYITTAILYRLFGKDGLRANLSDMLKPMSWLWIRFR